MTAPTLPPTLMLALSACDPKAPAQITHALHMGADDGASRLILLTHQPSWGGHQFAEARAADLAQAVPGRDVVEAYADDVAIRVAKEDNTARTVFLAGGDALAAFVSASTLDGVRAVATATEAWEGNGADPALVAAVFAPWDEVTHIPMLVS